MIKKFTLLFRRLAITLMAGLLAGFIAVSNTISYGVTIFSGDLSEHLSAGIGLALFSGLVLTATVALTSSIKGVIAFPKAAITPIFALLAAQIATGMPASATTDEVFFTIAVAFGVSTFSVGLVYLLFGLFKLGRLIRFMPHPVFGGFMAGLGWLLVTGGFGVMSDLSLKIGSISQWIQPDILVLWLPGLLFAIVLFILQKHFRHDVVIPITFLAALAIFYLVSWVTGISFIEMTRLGWLLDPLPGNEQQFHLILSNLQNINPALILTKLQNVNWDVISRQALTIIAPIPISLLSLLFNSSGIELATKQDVNLNRELKSAGIANILASCGGGIMGYQSASLSTLSHKMGAKNRFTGVFSAAFFGVVLFYSNSVLTVLPKTLIGGLLIYLGLTFLVRWVISSYAVLPK
ncbi:MAG: SulP family inorganic anion transporter, partial [Chloroflexota bacterium]|nr:SulP family inorganic anion transporter [Chloroflexota bacterium]